MFVSDRLKAVDEPIIPVIGDLIAANPGTISMAQGVVGFTPPESIWRRIEQFKSDPCNHIYQEVDGIPALKQALWQKLDTENGIAQKGRELVVTSGSNMAFLNVLFTIADPGDEVILFKPYFFNHEMALRMANVTPVLVDCDENHQPNLEHLQSAITAKTRAIITVSPNNPTGAVYSESLLKSINELCRSKSVYHLSDEAYEYFVYDEAKHFSPASITQSTEHTISLFSFSKSHGFASWRTGYAVIPEHLHLQVLKVQDTNPICAPVISQHAALALLQEGREFVAPQIRKLAEVRAALLDVLAQENLPIVISNVQGAFYLYPRVLTNIPSFELAKTLIEKHGVAVIPGDAFGDKNCTFRMSYGALKEENVREGIRRLAIGLKTISA